MGPGPMRALVLHPDITSDRSRRDAGPALEEAVALAAALPDLEVASAQIVRLPKAQPGLLFGTGKIAELKERIEALDVGLVLMRKAVSRPCSSGANLEKAWGVKLPTGPAGPWDPKRSLLARGSHREVRVAGGTGASQLPAYAGAGARLDPTWNASAVAWASLLWLPGRDPDLEADSGAIRLRRWTSDP